MYEDEDNTLVDSYLPIYVEGKEVAGHIVKNFTLDDAVYTCYKTEDGNIIFFQSEDITKDVTIVTPDAIRSHILSKVIAINQEVKSRRKFETIFVLIISFIAILLTSYFYLKTNEPLISFDNYGAQYDNAALIYDKVDDSVVLLRVYNSDESKSGSASGLIISEDGYIISCAHIYDDIANPLFKVVTNTGKTYQAAFVSGDVESDLCLLKIIKTKDTFRPVKFSDSTLVKPGDASYILGFPGGNTVEPVITSGIISHPDVRMRANNGYEIGCLQTDTTANPGHSGGGLFDGKGHVIGLVSAKYVSNTYENTIYCVPSATIQKVINSLYYNGYVARPTFGISFVDVNNTEMDNGIPYGGKLVEISETSPLYQKAEIGEIITAINGRPITLAYDFYDAVQDITVRQPLVVVQIYNVETKEYRDCEIVVTFRVSDNGLIMGTTEPTVPEDNVDTPEDSDDSSSEPSDTPPSSDNE